MPRTYLDFEQDGIAKAKFDFEAKTPVEISFKKVSHEYSKIMNHILYLQYFYIFFENLIFIFSKKYFCVNKYLYISNH